LGTRRQFQQIERPVLGSGRWLITSQSRNLRFDIGVVLARLSGARHILQAYSAPRSRYALD